MRVFSLSVACFLYAAVDCAVSANTPTQIHLSLAGGGQTLDPDAMAVTWQTAAGGPSVVHYGDASGALGKVATGENGSTYLQSYTHKVVLPDLAPGKTVYYVVGDGTTFSNESSFAAAPAGAESVRFSIFGDLGFKNGDETVAYLTKTLVPANGPAAVDLIWHCGDAGYADDGFLASPLSFTYEKVFDAYLTEMAPATSRIPYMVGVGNHEGECHSPACIASTDGKMQKLGNFTAFNHRFRMPSVESAGSANMWFSFNYGPVHFVNIDTETQDFSDGMACVFTKCGGFQGPGGVGMMEWLEADLAEANKHRDIRPWVFVAGHRPMYQGSSINTKFQAAVEGLFKTYGVDVYFSGHVHSYERDHPVYNGVVTKNATTHIMIGGAGNAEMVGKQLQAAFKAQAAAEGGETDRLLRLWNPPTKASLSNGPWTAVTDGTSYGIGKVEVNMTALHFDYIQTGSGKIFDSVNLYK